METEFLIVKLLDSGNGRFGIRVATEWDTATANGAFTIFNRDNIIENNTVIGTYWNGIEIVGPATIYNVIKGNKSSGIFGPGAGIEADKGASFNTFSDNLVVETANSIGAGFAAFRNQGTDNAVNPDRTATGNVWNNCVARNINQEGSQSTAGFVVNYSDGCQINNLIIEDLNPSGNADLLYGVQIFEATDTSVSNSIIKDVELGILINDNVSDVKISDSTINITAGGTGVRFTNNTSNVSIVGNVIDGGANGLAQITDSTTVNAVVEGNHFLNQTNRCIAFTLSKYHIRRLNFQ